MRIVETRDAAALERFMRRDAAAQVYGLADLDEPFWSKARAFAALDGAGEIRALCLVLLHLELPIVYAVAPPADATARELLRALAPELPDTFFANFPLGALAAFEASHEIEPHGEHVKMALCDVPDRPEHDLAGIETLGAAQLDELSAFYAGDAYRPDERAGRFFVPYMLDLAPWFGLREDGRLVAVAGLHVLSRRYGVAALGNIATRPDRRGRGLAGALTARLCGELAPIAPVIGLNVARANTAARRCYARVGFRELYGYDEAVLRRRRAG